jgi:hypothetical protein
MTFGSCNESYFTAGAATEGRSGFGCRHHCSPDTGLGTPLSSRAASRGDKCLSRSESAIIICNIFRLRRGLQRGRNYFEASVQNTLIQLWMNNANAVCIFCQCCSSGLIPRDSVWLRADLWVDINVRGNILSLFSNLKSHMSTFHLSVCPIFHLQNTRRI